MRTLAVLVATLSTLVAGCSSHSSNVGKAPDVNPSQSEAAAALNAALRVTGEVKIGDAVGGVALDPNSKTLYVANSLDRSVSIVDAKTKSVTGRIAVNTGPTDVALDTADNLLLVNGITDVRGNGGTLSLIDLGSNRVIVSITLTNQPAGLVVDPDNHVAYVGSGETGAVLAVDLRSRTMHPIEVAGASRSGGVAFDPATHTVYTVDQLSSTMYGIDPASGDVTSKVPIGSRPRRIGIDAERKVAYVPNVDSGTLTVVDLASKSVKKTLTVGSSPGGVGIDTSSHVAYVTDKDGSVYAINPDSLSVIGTIQVGESPTATIDPQTHVAYISGGKTLSIVEP